MRLPYYDADQNAVFFGGALNPINPNTGEPWEGEEEAAAFIATLPTEPEKAFQLTLVATAARLKASGEAVEIQEPFNLLTFNFGEALEVDVEVQDGRGNLLTHIPDGEGGLTPLNQTYTLPIPGLFGTSMEVIDVVFVEGKATAEVTFPTPGVWRIDKDQVNMHIAEPENRFAFSGLEFKAKRPAA